MTSPNLIDWLYAANAAELRRHAADAEQASRLDGTEDDSQPSRVRSRRRAHWPRWLAATPKAEGSDP